jgi:plastocyanin
MTVWAVGRRLAAVAAALGLTAMGCGSPTSPSNGGGGGGGGGTVQDSATITITSSGVVDVNAVTIRQGGRVTFVNNHTRPHDMSSDPHPEHTDCPPLDQVGFLSPGQSRTSGNLNTVRACGFHDHNEPGTTGLQGRITVVPQ